MQLYIPEPLNLGTRPQMGEPWLDTHDRRRKTSSMVLFACWESERPRCNCSRRSRRRFLFPRLWSSASEVQSILVWALSTRKTHIRPVHKLRSSSTSILIATSSSRGRRHLLEIRCPSINSISPMTSAPHPAPRDNLATWRRKFWLRNRISTPHAAERERVEGFHALDWKQWVSEWEGATRV